jgi:hypothetical protein
MKTNRVVGIIFQHNDTRGTVDTNLNFAIPIESILKEIPAEMESILEENNLGLLKISDFLYKVGLESELYKWINELYIPPLEYEEIKDVLKEKRIVFITGEREYGKTYTALRRNIHILTIRLHLS